MDKDECIRMANWWLAALRGGTFAYQDAINGIRKYAKQGGFTLADIGTSEEELESGRRLGLKLYGFYLLQKLRDGTIMYTTCVAGLHRTLEEANLYPEDLGSSDGELYSFLIVSDAEFNARLRKPSVYMRR